MGRKQTEIPGTEQKKIKALQDIGEEIAEHSLEKARIEGEIGKKKDKALELMKKHGLEVYKFTDDDGEIEIKLKTSKEKISVRRKTEEESDEEDSAGDSAGMQ